MGVNQLDSRFGAEVTGLDLSRPLDPVTRSRVNDLFVDNVVLCFRGQSFDRPEAFIRVAETWAGRWRRSPRPGALRAST